MRLIDNMIMSNEYIKNKLKRAYEERDESYPYTICSNRVIKEALNIIEKQEIAITRLKVEMVKKNIYMDDEYLKSNVEFDDIVDILNTLNTALIKKGSPYRVIGYDNTKSCLEILIDK